MADKIQATLNAISVTVGKTSTEVEGIARGQEQTNKKLDRINGRLRAVEKQASVSNQQWDDHRREHDQAAEAHDQTMEAHEREHDKAIEAHEREHSDLKSKGRIADIGSYIVAAAAGIGGWISGQ